MGISNRTAPKAILRRRIGGGDSEDLSVRCWTSIPPGLISNLVVSSPATAAAEEEEEDDVVEDEESLAFPNNTL